MNPNGLFAIERHRPANLLDPVCDNRIYQTTGGQPTASATIDLAAVARTSGIECGIARPLDELRSAVALFFAERLGAGRAFVRAIVSGEDLVAKWPLARLHYRYRFLDAMRRSTR